MKNERAYGTSLRAQNFYAMVISDRAFRLASN